VTPLPEGLRTHDCDDTYLKRTGNLTVNDTAGTVVVRVPPAQP